MYVEESNHWEGSFVSKEETLKEAQQVHVTLSSAEVMPNGLQNIIHTRVRTRLIINIDSDPSNRWEEAPKSFAKSKLSSEGAFQCQIPPTTSQTPGNRR